jgi:hypothetical protein
MRYGDIFGTSTDVTNGTEDFALVFRAVDDGDLYEAMRLQGRNLGIGTSSPSALLTVGSATVASPATAADELVLEGSSTGLTISSSGTTNSGSIFFGDADNNQRGRVQYNHNTDNLILSAGGTEVVNVKSTGLGLGVVPAGRTANLEILYTQSDAIKITDADVAHGMTSLTDTDCFGALSIAHGTEGGIRTSGFTEGSKAVVLAANATSGDTTKSTSAVGAVYWDCAEKNGTDVHAFDANENLFVITNRETARFIFDSDGDGHADSAWTTFDEHDDIAMLHDIEATMVPDTFGKAMKYDAPYLERIGIIGAGSLREENGKTRGMINYTRLSMLHHGAIRQVHQQLQDVKDFYEDKLAALESRLLRLEA